MKRFNAKLVPFDVISMKDNTCAPYPLLRSDNGTETVYSVSPIHGRSFIVGRTDEGRFIVSKGNGLAYSEHTFLYTPEMSSDVWGLLLKDDALRDFCCGQDVEALGVKTNKMECVLELDCPIVIPQTNTYQKPTLLQYNVECPYRVADAPFMEKKQIYAEVATWEQYNCKGFQDKYLIAADVIVSNLRIMHDHQVLHNALTFENLTWALELLDFELCRTPQHPYTKADYERHVCDLYDREIIDSYKIIIYIAGCLRETVDFKKIDAIFKDYGFDLGRYTVQKG